MKLNLLGLKIEFGEEARHCFAMDSAVKKYGDIQRLAEKLEKVGGDYSAGRQIHTCFLATSKKNGPLEIVVITNKETTREMVRKFLEENEVPVEG